MNDLQSKEAAVIGHLVHDFSEPLPPALARLLEHAPESFLDKRHGQTALAIRNLADDGHTVNTLSVQKKLEALEELFPDAKAFLNGFSDGVLTADLAECEAEALWPEYQTRQTKAVLSEALQTLDANPEQAKSVIRHTNTALAQLDESSSSTVHAIPLGDIPPAKQDDGSELLQNRFLCRHGSM
ncbi:MAG: hypothetical protein WCO56_26315, partial [Verrucomicrobiota bacterium]